MDALRDIQLFETESVKQISQVAPIHDFRLMLNNRKEDQRADAIAQMKAVITRFVDESLVVKGLGQRDSKGKISMVFNYQYTKSLDCLQALRDGCIREDVA